MLTPNRHDSTRGDTIIEVLLAITVFSLLAVGALALMNRGTQTSQKALEVTLVRQQIDAQAEALRYIHSGYMDNIADATSSEYIAWKKMVTASPSGYAVLPASVAPLEVGQDGGCPVRPNNAFILDAHNGTLDPGSMANLLSVSDNAPDSSPYAHVFYDDATQKIAGATGIWIEAAKSSPTSNYADFYIKACWYAPGDNTVTVLGTIVRLYAPN